MTTGYTGKVNPGVTVGALGAEQDYRSANLVQTFCKPRFVLAWTFWAAGWVGAERETRGRAPPLVASLSRAGLAARTLSLTPALQSSSDPQLYLWRETDPSRLKTCLFYPCSASGQN